MITRILTRKVLNCRSTVSLRPFTKFVGATVVDRSKQSPHVTINATGLSGLAARKVITDEIQVIHPHDNDKNAVVIDFGSGLQGKFTTVWLRDICSCPSCVNPLTGANLAFTADATRRNHNISSLNVDKESGKLYVLFGDGHKSEYELNWLKDIVSNNYKYPLYEESSVYGTKKFPDRVLWDGEQLAKSSLSVHWDEFMETNQGTRQGLEHLLKYGVFFLRGTPMVKGTVLKAIRRISHEKPTVFGTTFDVIVEPSPNAHTGCTSARLEHHTDLNYRERSAGLEGLHCIKSAESGGASFLVDGFHAAEILRKRNPEHFKLLTDSLVTFSYLDKPTNRWFREKWPVITIERNIYEGDRLREIHYNSLWMRPPLLPYDLLNAYYNAYKNFTDIIRDPKLQFKFMLEPGDLIMFNNRRLLHGRESFEIKPGQDTTRHLEGCYAGLDEAKSTYETLCNEE